MQPDFSALITNLIDALLESQIKIGYTNNPVGLYYPLSSLCRLLGTDADADAMDDLLKTIPDTPLGSIFPSRKGDRYCLTIPSEGVRYVHEHVHDSGFLTELIALLGTHHHGITIEEILAVFRRYSAHVICKEVKDDEFDYLVYFEDGTPDNYRYLFSMEMGHASYHRFTPADFDAFGFDV